MIMRDVATRAKVSPTTLYNLYNTKDELLLEALRERIADVWSRTASETTEFGLDRLVAQLHYSVQQTLEEPAYAKAIVLALLRANEGDQLVEVLIHRTRRAVFASLQAMQQQKQLRPNTGLQDLATALVGAFWANYLMWNKGAIELKSLERELKRSYLSLLLPVTRGAANKDTKNQLQDLLG